MFREASKGKTFINAGDFVVFVETCRGEKGMDEHKAAALITQTVLSAMAGFYFSISVQSVQLDLQGFLNPAFVATEKQTQIMTESLSHYYIYSSHNSYLRGNQLTSLSSTAPIVQALCSGVRVIKFDCWEQLGQIMVLHGNTLTRAVAFKDCLIAIKENTFLASDYPVIITIENHSGVELQKKAAIVSRKIFDNMLFYPSNDQRPLVKNLSPETLKDYIIISDQAPNDHLEAQVAHLQVVGDDPEAARNLADDKLDDANLSNMHHLRKAQRFKEHIKLAQRKTLLKVANTTAHVLRHYIMVDRIDVPKQIEFE